MKRILLFFALSCCFANTASAQLAEGGIDETADLRIWKFVNDPHVIGRVHILDEDRYRMKIELHAGGVFFMVKGCGRTRSSGYSMTVFNLTNRVASVVDCNRNVYQPDRLATAREISHYLRAADRRTNHAILVHWLQLDAFVTGARPD